MVFRLLGRSSRSDRCIGWSSETLTFVSADQRNAARRHLFLCVTVALASGACVTVKRPVTRAEPSTDTEIVFASPRAVTLTRENTEDLSVIASRMVGRVQRESGDTIVVVPIRVQLEDNTLLGLFAASGVFASP